MQKNQTKKWEKQQQQQQRKSDQHQKCWKLSYLVDSPKTVRKMINVCISFRNHTDSSFFLKEN